MLCVCRLWVVVLNVPDVFVFNESLGCDWFGLYTRGYMCCISVDKYRVCCVVGLNVNMCLCRVNSLLT